ncbi:hypothetical protein R3P38DRAFT_2771939 [Favolaschia claudopus]|uniref:Uncharacterized protein n=1 Tax=Favolaschia claudopus TaxID=2862362 RepID=A0AAW0C8W5_9AGAR
MVMVGATAQPAQTYYRQQILPPPKISQLSKTSSIHHIRKDIRQPINNAVLFRASEPQSGFVSPGGTRMFDLEDCIPLTAIDMLTARNYDEVDREVTIAKSVQKGSNRVPDVTGAIWYLNLHTVPPIPPEDVNIVDPHAICAGSRGLYIAVKWMLNCRILFMKWALTGFYREAYKVQNSSDLRSLRAWKATQGVCVRVGPKLLVGWGLSPLLRRRQGARDGGGRQE